MNIKQRILLIIGLGLLVFSLLCNKSKTPEQRLDESRQKVLVDVKGLKDKLELAQEGYPVFFTVGSLPGDVEGSTHITEDGATITVDVNKVTQDRDCLEAVIGHEMYHIIDARLKYGVGTFIVIVDKEKDLPWESRTVEKSAIVQEDHLREELLATGRYNGIARTRAAQNARRPR